MSALETLASVESSLLPQHIAVIMDGNGRWAQAKGKARAFGHKAGVESVRSAVRFCRKHDISALTVSDAFISFAYFSSFSFNKVS